MGPLLLLALLAHAPAGAQADDSIPASSNVPGAAYPRVHTDGRVSFRLRAPEATSVRVQPGGADNGLGPGPFDMRRDAEGTWAVTTPPAVPGFHYYWLVVDGVAVNDPGSETYFGWGRPTSGVEVPEPGVDFYDARDVPHGEVRALWYHSEVTGTVRRALVYTPPGYDDEPDRRYPVLYLQHGAGEDERAWTAQGRANFILDNLLAEGRAEPMLLVMERGYAEAARGGDRPASTRPDPVGFEAVLLGELIPLVDATYRTGAEREHRALAGLSMGARQALTIGLGHREEFAWIGAMSPPPVEGFDVETAYGGAFGEPGAFNTQMRLLWLGAGTGEERFVAGVRTMCEGLERQGIEHVVYESAGTAHEWQTWRRSLHELAPLLFGD
ncbi:alpha/beta hydrolase-fold protein [Tautonia plasticadhaerens]|uniref:Carbohydrate acetyl esterase/feruloyl esterase n=1 Tax=Tautonia plasticadhaerens TaxID=2527974 RepID=A0A518HE22_9BACT|nr:alpha/beta hydrolase-fold protein [Tautonia plasticadhaerens]QDV39093.1 Carbohydrate acetyl esterase/feruloyl esterase precursor [Tautonia plasticadhaerens]